MIKSQTERSVWLFCNVFCSDQPQLPEGCGDAVLVDGGADAGAAGLEGRRAVGHAVADAGHVGHFEVVFAVAKGHRRRGGQAEMLADAPDALALVELAVDELAVDAAGAVGLEGLGLAEVELIPIGRLGRQQGGCVGRDVADFVDGLTLVLFQRADEHPVGEGPPPALQLAVQGRGLPGLVACKAFQHPGAAVGGVFGFEGAVHPVGLQKGAHPIALGAVHRAVEKDLLPADDVAARAAHIPVKAVAEQRRGHPVVAAGAEKHLVPVCAGGADGLCRAGRGLCPARLDEGAVDVEKNQSGIHSVPPSSGASWTRPALLVPCAPSAQFLFTKRAAGPCPRPAPPGRSAGRPPPRSGRPGCPPALFCGCGGPWPRLCPGRPAGVLPHRPPCPRPGCGPVWRSAGGFRPAPPRRLCGGRRPSGGPPRWGRHVLRGQGRPGPPARRAGCPEGAQALSRPRRSGADTPGRAGNTWPAPSR